MPPCGKPVDDRWISCGAGDRPDLFSTDSRAKVRGPGLCGGSLRTSFAADPIARAGRIRGHSAEASPPFHREPPPLREGHRRPPVSIEVALIAERRWRANIVRIPGVPAALMPFYGETPDEAAGLPERVADARPPPRGGYGIVAPAARPAGHAAPSPAVPRMPDRSARVIVASAVLALLASAPTGPGWPRAGPRTRRACGCWPPAARLGPAARSE